MWKIKKTPAINRWQEYYILKTDSISIGKYSFVKFYTQNLMKIMLGENLLFKDRL